MKTISEKNRQRPDFGGDRIGEIEPTGDKEQDFNNAMVALRDDNYEAFIDDLNTLAGDPKVKNLRDAIVDKFNSKDGVQVFFSSETDMPIRNIHPTQFEVDMEKSLSYPLQKKPAGLVDILAGEKPLKLAGLPLVVAEIDGTNYIIDGHHRWSQVYCLNPDAKMVVRVLKSDMLQHPDDALKLVQMEIFVAKDGKELPQSKVESGYNLYTIDEDSFKKWCQNTMSEDAKRIFDKLLSGKDPIEYMWQNVKTMREEAEPTPNAHGREDMPQTDRVDGEFISPRAEEVSENTKISESNKRKIKMRKLNITKERFEKSNYFKRKYGKLEYVSESGNLYKTNKGKVLMFKESTMEPEDKFGEKYENFIVALEKYGSHGQVHMFGPENMYVSIPRLGIKDVYDEVDKIRMAAEEVGWRIPPEGDIEKSILNDRRIAAEIAIIPAEDDLTGEYNESTKKFGRKFVNGSKGKVLMFKEGVFGDIGDAIDDGIRGVKKFFHRAKFKKGDKIMVCMGDFSPPGVQHGLEVIDAQYGGWSGGWEYRTGTDDWGNPEWWPELRVALDTDPDGGYEEYDPEKFPEFKKLEKYMKKKDSKKEQVNEGADADPALVCPYCGGNNCEVSIGTDDLNFTNLDRLQGETFNVECWCNDCDKPYNVTVELNVKDVYPNEDADELTSDWE